MTAKRLRIIMGENVRKIRTNCGLSIFELAELLGITHGFLGSIERGERGTTPLALLKLSKIFNVPIEHFFFKNDYTTDSYKSRIEALTYDFTESELDFVIYMMEGVKSHTLS